MDLGVAGAARKNKAGQRNLGVNKPLEINRMRLYKNRSLTRVGPIHGHAVSRPSGINQQHTWQLPRSPAPLLYLLLAGSAPIAKRLNYGRAAVLLLTYDPRIP